MSLLIEVFDWVAGQLPATLVSGTNWHCGHLLPEYEGPLSVLVDRGGPPERHNYAELGENRFQVITIGSVQPDVGFLAVEDFALGIDAVLRDAQACATATYQVMGMQGLQRPTFVPTEDRSRWEFSANYLCYYRTTATWDQAA